MENTKGACCMRWISIDPANKSGVAFWDGDELIGTAVLCAVGKSGKYRVNSVRMECRWSAWEGTLIGFEHVVIEEGCGRFSTAIKAQAALRGYVQAVCEYRTLIGANVAFTVVNVSEWRRVIKEAYGVSWPATTERKKALSVQLVAREYGRSVTDDEADAVLLGVAAMRMGLVECKPDELKGGAK